jgi:hypothetical protein
MKHAFLSLLIISVVMAFFSFTNYRSHLVTEGYTEDDDQSAYTTDTVPHKKNKDSAKHQPKTVPYDSFGKPKKMDSTVH